MTNAILSGSLSRRNLLRAGAAGLLASGMSSRLASAAESRANKAQIEKALAALDKDKLVKLTLDLVNIPSPLGREEQSARFFARQMDQAGLQARFQPFAPG